MLGIRKFVSRFVKLNLEVSILLQFAMELAQKQHPEAD